MPISEAHKEKLRISIINAAVGEFIAHGYTGASIDAIVKKAGGSKTNVYTYFDGKAGLFLATIETFSRNILLPLRTIDLPNGDVRQALFHFGSVFLQAVLSREAIQILRLIIAESERFQGLANIFLDSGPNYAHQLLAQYIERKPVSDYFTVDAKPEIIATLFVNMISRDRQMRQLLGVDDVPTIEEIRAILKPAVALLVRHI